MPSNATPIDAQRNTAAAEVQRTKRQRADVEPRVPSIRRMIYGRWKRGASEKNLADAVGCTQRFVLAVVRSEAQRREDELLDEIARLRRAA